MGVKRERERELWDTADMTGRAVRSSSSVRLHQGASLPPGIPPHILQSFIHGFILSFFCAQDERHCVERERL